MVRIYFGQLIFEKHAQFVQSNWILLCIVALSIFLNFYNLGERAFQQDEAIYSAQSAIIAGHDEYSKNFLSYSRSATNFQVQQFIVGVSFRLFGISEFSARLPSATMGILTVIIVYILATTLFNRRVGLLSAFIMTINGYVVHFVRQTQLDTGLLFFMTLAILCIIKWHKTEKDIEIEKGIESNKWVNKYINKDWYFYIFLISAILAIMTKITAVFVLIPLIIFYLYIEKEFDNAIDMMDKRQSALIISMALLFTIYFIFLVSGYDEFMKTLTYATDRESKYSYTYYINIMTGYFGYLISTITIIGLIYSIRNGIKEKNKEDIFCTFWFLFGIIFFSFYPLKAYSYILPIAPAICILNGRVLDSLLDRIKMRKFVITIILILIIISVYPTYNHSYAKTENLDEVGPDIINRYNPIKDMVLKDTALWLKENVDPNEKIAVYQFPSHHNIAFYSGLETYTVKFEPGFYIPVNGTAKIVWNNLDIKELIKSGDISYVLYLSVGDQRFAKILREFEKKENIKFISYYQKNYTVPEWYSVTGLSVTIYKVEKGRNEIKFVTIGDPHIRSSDTENKGNDRLKKIVNFVNNKQDVDFVVLMGDMTEEGTNESNMVAKRILSDLEKPYYVVAGDHDILVSEDTFRLSYGPIKHTETINGYQLLFIGIFSRKDENNNVMKLGWSFNFSKIDKNMKTLVFMHGIVKDPPPECTYCRWDKDFIKYAYSIQPELDKFKYLIGVYSGHVHYDSDQTFNGVRYITTNGLVQKNIGNISTYPSDKIGYTIINNGRLSYQLISYE